LQHAGARFKHGARVAREVRQDRPGNLLRDAIRNQSTIPNRRDGAWCISINIRKRFLPKRTVAAFQVRSDTLATAPASCDDQACMRLNSTGRNVYWWSALRKKSRPKKQRWPRNTSVSCCGISHPGFAFWRISAGCSQWIRQRRLISPRSWTRLPKKRSPRWRGWCLIRTKTSVSISCRNSIMVRMSLLPPSRHWPTRYKVSQGKQILCPLNAVRPRPCLLP